MNDHRSQRTGDTFAATLRALFTTAGSPTVAVAARAAGTSSATVSNWRTGRHLPADFDAVEPLLVWLTVRARDRAEHPEAVWDIGRWQALLASAHGRTLTVDAMKSIAETAEAWTVATGVAASEAGNDPHHLVRTAILAHIAVTASGRTTGRELAPGDVPARGEAAIIGLIESGALVSSASGTKIVDPALIDAWPRLQDWVAEYSRDIDARTALIEDALRWATAGHPRDRLYDHIRLAATARSLVTLAPTPPDLVPASAYRFGSAAVEQIPTDARSFWTASQDAATAELRTHRIVMTVLILLIAAVVVLIAIAAAQ